MKKIHPKLYLAGLLGLAAVITGSGVAARYQTEMQARQARIEQLGARRIDTPCGPMDYVTTGSGDPVLVVHGLAGGIDQGLGLGQSYLDSGFQLIVPSRFGYLGSPMPANASVAMQADAYACLLDALGIQKVAVFATSAGVTSSVEFALRHPDRVSALVLHSPNAPGEPGLAAPPRAMFNALLHSDFAFWSLTTAFKKNMLSLVGVPKDFVLTPEFQASADEALASSLPVSRRVEGMLFDTYTGNPAIQQIPLEQVRTPTLVISAVDDPMALHKTARVLAERIPGARLMAVSDGGHLMLGHTPEVQAETVAFLRRIQAP